LSPDLAALIKAEIEELDSLLSKNSALLEVSQPNLTEIQAIAAVLHSFYTGLENVFKRVARQGARPLAGDNWHSALLQTMKEPQPDGSTIIDSETYVLLKGYLKFRHVFRQGYSTSLEWPKMAPLAQHLNHVYAKVRAQLTRFAERPF
jgi:hypothetical protein